MFKRDVIVNKAISWLGKKESDSSFHSIIDIYNSNRPLPRGYKMKYSDAWCATFVSAVAIDCGYTEIIPQECSCYYMINKFKQLNEWVEDDSYVPSPGDIIFYDWDDNGIGDNISRPDHVGIVEKVENNIITVIEGNCSNMVKRRILKVNGRYIRGYGVPKYSEEDKNMEELNMFEKWAVDNGLFKGYPDGKYHFDKPITRGEICIVLYNLVKWLGKVLGVNF